MNSHGRTLGNARTGIAIKNPRIAANTNPIHQAPTQTVLDGDKPSLQK